MSLKSVLDSKPRRKRQNAITIHPDIGWVGPHPARTRAEKIKQIKTEFFSERPLLIEGATAADFAEYPSISAAVSVPSLIQYVDSMKDGKFWVIAGLDKATREEQEKFVVLIKDRQILASKLPPKVQIIIPVKDVSALLPAIQSPLTFKVNLD